MTRARARNSEEWDRRRAWEAYNRHGFAPETGDEKQVKASAIHCGYALRSPTGRWLPVSDVLCSEGDVRVTAGGIPLVFGPDEMVAVKPKGERLERESAKGGV